MKKINTPFQINLLAGFILGQVLFGWYHIKLLTIQYEVYERAADIMMLIIIIMGQYWAIKWIKEKFFDNFISFRKAFLHGLVISIFSFLFISIDFLVKLHLVDHVQEPSIMGVFYLSFSVLLYSVFLNIFVSMFLKSEARSECVIDEDDIVEDVTDFDEKEDEKNEKK